MGTAQRAARVIRPVASVDELAEAFDVVGAQLPQRLTHADRRFADLVARFPADRALMLVVEDRGRIVGGALAFRTGPRNVTLRAIGLAPGVRGIGLGRRLVEAVEREAARLDVGLLSLGAADGAAGFYARLGYEEADGAFHKPLDRRRARRGRRSPDRGQPRPGAGAAQNRGHPGTPRHRMTSPWRPAAPRRT